MAKTKTPNKKISFGDGILNNSEMSFPEKNVGEHTPKQYGEFKCNNGLPSTAECLAMSDAEVNALKGRAKSKAKMIRGNAKKRAEGHLPNPKGHNKWTKENAMRDYRENAALKTLEKLKETVPHAIDVIVDIMKTGTDLNKLRACELVLAYQIAKPAVRKDEKHDSDVKTFVVLPPDAIIEGEVIKMPKVENPEKK